MKPIKYESTCEVQWLIDQINCNLTELSQRLEKLEAATFKDAGTPQKECKHHTFNSFKIDLKGAYTTECASCGKVVAYSPSEKEEKTLEDKLNKYFDDPNWYLSVVNISKIATDHFRQKFNEAVKLEGRTIAEIRNALFGDA